MSRYDREDIEFLNLPEPPSAANYYIKDGSAIERDEYDKLDEQPIICAKEVQHKDTKITTYSVLCNTCNQLFDPKDTDSRYKVRTNWKFRHVNRATFDLYIRFLKHNYKSLRFQAERGL